MHFKPILFSTSMVQAIIDGCKTMTRRKVKGMAADWLLDEFTPEFVASHENKLCPYGQPGDILWVRESWCKYGPIHKPVGHYRADYSDSTCYKYNEFKWKPGIHMPKAACRLFLEITDIRIERLQDISPADCISEGIIDFEDGTFKNYHTKKGLRARDGVECILPMASFQSLWYSINGDQSWAENPWLWVISFKQVELSQQQINQFLNLSI